MKIAVSSTTFSRAFANGATTQLEWLDACANELEIDGVVLARDDFPRVDDDYLAQIKKTATDLGLTIAGISLPRLPDDTTFALALALGAPLVIASAPAASDDPNAWNAFAGDAKTCARAAKHANVVVALANVPGTLCASADALRRIAYDVDGSWLRYALDPLNAADAADLARLLPKAVIVRSAIGDPATFAVPGDDRVAKLIASLARFRGFIVLESDAVAGPAYHQAIARFVDMRAMQLAGRGSVTVKS